LDHFGRGHAPLGGRRCGGRGRVFQSSVRAGHADRFGAGGGRVEERRHFGYQDGRRLGKSDQRVCPVGRGAAVNVLGDRRVNRGNVTAVHEYPLLEQLRVLQFG